MACAYGITQQSKFNMLEYNILLKNIHEFAKVSREAGQVIELMTRINPTKNTKFTLMVTDKLFKIIVEYREKYVYRTEICNDMIRYLAKIQMMLI